MVDWYEHLHPVVSVDYFAPLQVTPRGSTYILLLTDHFSRRANMYPVTAAEFTAEGTANIPINRYIPLWRCSRSTLSDHDLQFRSKLSHAVYKLLGVRKISTRSYHPNGNGGMDRVNHTMAQMLTVVVNELQISGMSGSLTSNLRTTIRSALLPV